MFLAWTGTLGGFICIIINNDDNVLVFIFIFLCQLNLTQGQLLFGFFSFTDFILHSGEIYMECRSRIGEELLLASLESAGSGRGGGGGGPDMPPSFFLFF